MKEQFINSKIIGIIYKNLVSKLNLQLDSDAKTKLTKKMIAVMNQVFINIDISRVNQNNFKNILRQFINTCYQTIYIDINKNVPVRTEKFTQQNSQQNSQQSRQGQNSYDPRSSSRNDNFASFNDSFNINQNQSTVGFQGRYGESVGMGKKSDFSKNLDDRYSELQNEYRDSYTINKKPPTPPELQGDKGANLNKMTKENLKNKQNLNNNSYTAPQMSSKDFLKAADPRAKVNLNSKDNISKDTFDFGTVNDVDNNYDVIDGSNNNIDGNMNQWNTGINPTKFNIDESTPLEQKLKQFQMERENLDAPVQSQDREKKQVRFNESANQYQQFNQQQSHQQSHQQQSHQQSQQQVRQQYQHDDEQERNYRMRDLEREHLKREADRVVDIPKEQYRVPENEGFSNSIETKLSEYETTIGLLLDKVKDLQQQQINHMSNNVNTQTDDKIRLLEVKKGEILGEVTRLQSLTLDLEKQQNVIQEKEQKIKQRELDIDFKIRKFDSLINMDEKQLIIKASSGKFTYSLSDPLKNVNIIQLVNYNIPYDENNININNNKLYFSIITDNSKKVNNDSDNDILTTDSEDYVEEVHINSNKLNVMTIPPDNYDIYGLLEMMNKIGNKWNIYFSLVKGRVIIKTNKNSRLKLYLDRDYQNNILFNLGFIKIIGDKYKHIAEKKYNIKNEKMIQLYLKNISTEPFAEFLIGSEKIYKFNKDFNIDLLSKLDIEMKINDKIFVPDEPYALEFNILMNTNSNITKNTSPIAKNTSQLSSNLINNSTKTINPQDDVNTDDNDLLEKVSSMMKL